MDFYDDAVNEIVAEALASEPRESRANVRVQPVTRTPGSHPIQEPSPKAPAKATRRRARHRVPPKADPPAVTLSGTAGAAEASMRAKPRSCLPRRQTSSARRKPVRGDDGAHHLNVNLGEGSPVVANLPAQAGDTEGALSSGEILPGFSPLSVELSPQGDGSGAQSSNAIHRGKSPAPEESSQEDGGDGAQAWTGTRAVNSPIVAEIIQLWRMRQRWHRAEKSLILQGRALCRAWTAGDKEAANKLFDLAADGKSEDPVLELALMPFLKAIGNFKPERAAVEKRLKKLAQSLPVWPWVASVKGFGPMNLAALVGEAGDIGSYRNPSCLWKRMGMAVIDGERQRKCADADKALRHGYNPARRAVAYLIGETLLKAGTRERYDTRRAHTAETHPEWPKARSHNDALRVNAKDILRRLWAAWRGSDGVAEEIGT